MGWDGCPTLLGISRVRNYGASAGGYGGELRSGGGHERDGWARGRRDGFQGGGWPRTKDDSGNKADQAFGAKYPPPTITIQLMVRWLYVSPKGLGLSNPRSLPTWTPLFPSGRVAATGSPHLRNRVTTQMNRVLSCFRSPSIKQSAYREGVIIDVFCGSAKGRRHCPFDPHEAAVRSLAVG